MGQQWIEGEPGAAPLPLGARVRAKPMVQPSPAPLPAAQRHVPAQSMSAGTCQGIDGSGRGADAWMDLVGNHMKESVLVGWSIGGARSAAADRRSGRRHVGRGRDDHDLAAEPQLKRRVACLQRIGRGGGRRRLRRQRGDLEIHFDAALATLQPAAERDANRRDGDVLRGDLALSARVTIVKGGQEQRASAPHSTWRG